MPPPEQDPGPTASAHRIDGVSGVVGFLILVGGGAALALLRRRGQPWPWDAWLLRGGLVLAASLAAAGLEADLRRAGGTRVLVLDRSRSLARGRHLVARAAQAALADLDPRRDRVAIVLAGARPSVVLLPSSPQEAAARLEEALGRAVDPWGSDLGAALRLALTLVDEGGGEVVLISDGRDTSQQAIEAASSLAARRVPIHTFAPDAPAAFGARLARFDLPSRAARFERIPAQIEVQALRPTQVTVRVERISARGPVHVGELSGRAGPGQPLHGTLLVPALVPGRAGELTLRARLEVLGRDDAPEDDVLEARVLVGRGARALRVGPRLPGLKGPGIVVSPQPVDGLAAALRAGLPDLVVLHEVPYASLAPAMPALAAVLRAGAGLLVVGARAAFGPGGYAGSPLEAWLPVTSGPGQERKRPLHLAVAVDASGSMAQPEGNSRYLRAITAGLPLHRIRKGDQLAVILFSDQPRLVHPLGPIAPGLRERLVKEKPKGGTDIGAALVQALVEVASVEGKGDRIVILATDAEDEQVGRHQVTLERLATKLQGTESTVLLIQIGAGPTDALLALKRFLPGLAVRVRRAETADEALRALVEGELLARRALVRQGSFPVRLAPAGRARNLSPPARVEAFAPVRLRSEPAYAAQALVLVRDAETADPPGAVLGRVGLSRILALPIEGGQASSLVRSLAPELVPPGRQDVALTLTRAGRELIVAARGADLPLGLRVRLEGVDGARATAELTPLTPSRHEARIAAPSPGALHAVLEDREGRQRFAVGTVRGTAHDELLQPGADHALLTALSETTGGQPLTHLPSATQPVGRAWARRRGAAALAPWFGLLALVLLVLEAGALTFRTRFAHRSGSPA